ncbi:MAG TPA: DUF4352 domain-containing protein [Blastocatellia bacterium]|nr:DUF4352 domain-containing protein [Blastocatellia bacterium]
MIVGVCLAMLALVALLNRRSQMVGLNQEIQYDDFAFSVLGARTAAVVGDGQSRARAHGLFCVVTMKIANHALRVDYTFDKSDAILVDDHGNEFRLSAEGQKALEENLKQDELCERPIPAGASCVTQVVFDLPADVRVSQLRISEGGQVGDVLDTIFYGKKRIAIPAGE